MEVSNSSPRTEGVPGSQRAGSEQQPPGQQGPATEGGQPPWTTQGEASLQGQMQSGTRGWGLQGPRRSPHCAFQVLLLPAGRHQGSLGQGG